MRIAKNYGLKDSGEYWKLKINHSDEVKIREHLDSYPEVDQISLKRNAIFEKSLICLHLIVFRGSIKKHEIGSELRKICGASQNFDLVLGILEGLELIEIDHAYCSGKDGSPFGKKYFHKLEVPVEGLGNDILKSRLLGILKKKELTEERYALRYNWFDGISIDPSFDVPEFMKIWLAEKWRIKRVEWSNLGITGEDLIEAEKEYQSRLVTRLAAVDDLISGNLKFFKKRNSEGRLYSTINQIPSELRKHLLYSDGSRMVERDVKSSQPRILAKVLIESIIQNWNEFKWNNFKNFYQKSTDEKISIQDIIAKIKLDLSEIEDIAKGDIYQHLANETGISRDEAKSSLLIYLNDYRETNTVDSVKIIKFYFADRYLKVFALISYLHKREYELRTKSDCRYSEFSISKNLAYCESELILETSKKFRMTCPEVAIATVHDSVLVPAEYGEIMDSLLETTYISKGLKLELKVEKFEEIKIEENLNKEIASPPQEQEQVHIPFNVLIVEENTPLTVKSSGTNVEVPVPTPVPSQEVPVPSTWNIDRVSTIRVDARGRYVTSVKNKPMASRKGETLDAFRSRCIELGAILT